jgi:hypothetical protein
MFNGIISLASYGISNGGFVGELLYNLEQNGVFSYVLPFLMIFAVVYGILLKVKIFGDNKGLNVIVAFVVSLMSLQFNFVSYFFSEVFPRMGVMVSIILVLFVLMGLFWDFKNKSVNWIFGILIFIGFIVILFQSFSSAFGFGWSIGEDMGYFFERNLAGIITGILLVGGIIAIVASSSKKKENEENKSVFEKLADLGTTHK